jgi:hypothetical protein
MSTEALPLEYDSTGWLPSCISQEALGAIVRTTGGTTHGHVLGRREAGAA